MSNRQVDAVIIGAGASGSVLARQLSLAGLRVIVLERGPRIDPEDFREHDELTSQSWGMSRPAPFGPDDRHPREFRFQNEERFRTVYPGDSGYAGTPQVVGGAQLVYGALMWRRPPIDFRMKTEYGHVAGSTLEDWPFTYDQLEPYFEQAEHELGVSGEGGANPFEGKRNKPFPCPPVETQPGDKRVAAAAERLGYHPFVPPLGLITENYRGRIPCWRHPCCNGFVCEVGSKSTPLTSLLPEAVASGNCEIVPLATAKEVTVDAKGRVDGVAYFDQAGALQRQSARLVIVAGSAIETPRLLLNSTSHWFPHGLGNGNGWVGRNLMGHINPGVYATFDDVSNDGFGPGPGVAIDDFCSGNPGFVGGGVIYSRTEVTPIVFTRIRPDNAPSWGLAHKRYQRENFHRYIRLTAVGEDMPQFENRVEVSPTVRDAWGIPVARITHSYHPNDYLVWDFMERKQMELLKEAGARNLASRNIGKGGVGAHQCGTCRVGKDPETSVMNEYGQSHEVDNLFVVDASCFVTSGGKNPVLTIQALAFRFAEYIVRQWNGGAWRAGRREL